jgi:YHS domain-containing protein
VRKEVKVMAQDPVCKMTVDENTAAAKSVYKGKTYFFCAEGCKESFEKEPDRFVEE